MLREVKEGYAKISVSINDDLPALQIRKKNSVKKAQCRKFLILLKIFYINLYFI